MPRGLLGDLGRVEYNGYRFNNTTRTLAYRVRPVPDSSGRTTAYNELYISLQTWISASSTTDPEVMDAVERLSHRGRGLIVRGRGLGSPEVNTGGIKDVRWGPEPGEINCSVIGTGNAVKLTWSVTARVPNCRNGRFEFAALEFNYIVEHLVDDAGFTTRTVRGHLAIPMTWKGQERTLPDSVDEYRLTIPPALIRRFRRTYGPWVVSEDRTRLDFSITDSELGGDVIPPGVVDARASETVSSSQTGLASYVWTINGSYRLRRGLSGVHAAAAFFDLVTKRIKILELNGLQFPVKDAKGKQTGRSAPIPVGFSMANPDHYGKPAADFSLSFTFVHQLSTILNLTGLWARLDDPANPVPGGQLNTWEGWASSLGDSAFHPYGGVRLRFTTGDDRINDLCQNEAVLKGNPDADVIRQQTVELRRSAGNIFDRPDVVERGIAELVNRTFVPPKPADSWMSYQNELWLEVDNGVCPIRMLAERVLKRADDVLGPAADIAGRVFDALKPLGGVLPIIAGELLPPPAGPGIPGGRLETTGGNGTMRRVPASGYIYLRGFAVRAGYAIDPPRLLDVNGVEVVPACRLDRGEGFGKGVKANGNVPLHFCKWNLRYYLPRLLDIPLPTPPNPLQGGK